MKKAINLKGLRFIFDIDNLLSKIEEQLKKSPADCVIIDAFADVYDGDINAVNRVRTFIQGFSGLAQRYECLIIFLHHTGKRTEALIPSKDNLLGSQGFEGKMRMVAELRQDPKDLDIRHLCIVKGNYLPQDIKQASFVLHFTGESMTFQNTGNRTEFKHLVKRALVDSSNWEIARETSCELRRNGHSIREIAVELERLRLPGKKSAIREWVKDVPYLSDRESDILPEDTLPVDPTEYGDTYYDMLPEEPFDD